MPITTRISLITRDAESFFSDELSADAQSAALAAFARSNLSEAQETNRRALGSVPDHETIVDGSRGKSEDAVRPDGVIVHDFEILDDMFGYIDLLLIKHSPVLTGKYRRSHVLYADGVEIDPAAATIPDASEYVYLSVLPYARKIERGLSKQAPDGVYEVTAALAAKRFGNMARIRFSYRSPLGAYVALPRKKRVTFSGKVTDRDRKGRLAAGEGDRDAHNRERETRVPAIVITR